MIISKRLQKIFSVFLFISFLVIPQGNLFSATDDFLVQTLVGGDTTPPTIPAPFTVVPVATSQVNLSWGASTDDWTLSGYHVWRDGLQVATTTATSYSDAGLTASTSYSYYVTAYDSFFNESASSTEIATTTLQIPPTPSSTPTTQGTRVRWLQDEIVSLVVLPERDSVVIRYETNNYIQSVIKWGRTTSFELGSLAEHAFNKFHETRISGLTPGTRYQFTIEGGNRFNRYGQLHVGEFVTLPPDDIFAPGNVSNLTAVRSGEDIVLSWKNPSDVDFSKVRVVRSDNFYPSDIADGWVVYEGNNTAAVDKSVDYVDLWRYYTVFSYDDLGNISSGSVVRLYLGYTGGVDELVPEPPEADPAKNEISLSLSDIVFSQENNILEPQDEWSIELDGTKQLTIEIPYELLPEHLKTILVVLGDKDGGDKIFKFLLRINSDKTAYTGTLAPFGQSGIFPVQFSIFDFKTAQIGYTEGILVSNILSLDMSEAESSFIMKLVRTLTRSSLLFGIIALIAMLYVGRRLLRAKW